MRSSRDDTEEEAGVTAHVHLSDSDNEDENLVNKAEYADKDYEIRPDQVT